MAWKDRLQQGSFRKVSFYTQETSGQGGRRVAVHEYPQQEQHYAEDIGKKSESEKLKVVLLGSDYDVTRDKLITALNQPGPGVLVHPHFGTLNVQITEYDWVMSTRQGGYCEFNIQYVLVGKREYPTSTDSETTSNLADAIAEALSKILDELTNTFNLDDMPEFVKESAEELVQTAAESIQTLNDEISGYSESNTSTIADDIENFIDDISSIAADASTMAESFIDIVSESFEEMSDLAEVFTSYDSLLESFTTTTLSPKLLTPTRQQQLANKQALENLFTSSLTIAAANMLTNEDYSFTTIDEAQTARDQLLTQLDDLIDNSSDDMYDALVDLQTAIIRRVDALEPNLSNVQTVQYQRSVPALVMAYQLYGDASRETELISRNNIKNPNVVPAGTDIEVLDS